MDVEKIHTLPKIPMLRTPVFRDIEIAGKTVRVHKPRARQAAMVATRLAESFGETLLAVFVSPDGDITSLGSKLSAGKVKLSLIAGFMPTVSKRLRELGDELGEDHIAWYFENILVGNVELEGYRFATLEEFDVSGFGFEELLELLACAAELAIYPTSDDPSTGDGKSDPVPVPEVVQRRAVQTPPTRAQKRRGGTNKGGQSAPMSASRG